MDEITWSGWGLTLYLRDGVGLWTWGQVSWLAEVGEA